MSLLESFDRTRDSIKALTLAFATIVGASGCSTISPQRAGSIAGTTCGMAGAGAAAAANRSNNEIAKIAVPIITGFGLGNICNNAAQAWAEQRGKCNEKVNTVNGQPSTSSNCERSTKYPNIPPQHGY